MLTNNDEIIEDIDMIMNDDTSQNKCNMNIDDIDTYFMEKRLKKRRKLNIHS